jgi:AraC-like DNA-binding protein
MSISSTVLDRADIRFHTATPALQPYVGCFWIISAQCGATVRVVPDGTTSIAIEQQQDCASVGYLRGPLLRPVELRFTVPTTLVGVRLRPGVAFSLSGITTHSIVDRRTDFSDHATLRELTLASKPQTPIEWIAALEKFLIDRLKGKSIHPIVARALAEIHAEHGRICVPEIAARCGTGKRNLSRLMRDWVGYGPKRYSNIVRFQSTLAQMERAPALPVAMLAPQIGYFDQSHLTADMTRHAGMTPGRLISAGVSDFSKTYCDVPF